MKNGPGRRLRYGMCGTGTTNSDRPVDTYMTYGTRYMYAQRQLCTHEGVQLAQTETHTIYLTFSCTHTLQIG